MNCNVCSTDIEPDGVKGKDEAGARFFCLRLVPWAFLASAFGDHRRYSHSESRQRDIRPTPGRPEWPAVYMLQTADNVFRNSDSPDSSSRGVSRYALRRAPPALQNRRTSAAMECAHRRYEFSRSQTVLAIADRTLGCEATTGCSSSKARHHRFGSGQRHRHGRRKSARRSRPEICPYTKLSGGFEADLDYPARAGRWSRSGRPDRAPPVTNDQCIARAQMSTGRSPTATRSGEVRFWNPDIAETDSKRPLDDTHYRKKWPSDAFLV